MKIHNLCTHIASSRFQFLTAYNMQTVSDQKLDGGKAWEQLRLAYTTLHCYLECVYLDSEQLSQTYNNVTFELVM